ncbi:MAG TPA: helix-turn-helix domain-containing protein [Reyranella sp.]|jgi:hypothetical protein|nr:helix-turn-helix domain-containing protein [Reyranella sp.]
MAPPSAAAYTVGVKPTIVQETGTQKPAQNRPATAPARIVAVADEEIARLFVTSIIGYMSRLEREKRGLYGSDLDLASVFEVVAIGAIEPGMRDPGFRAAYASFEAVVGIEGQRGINAMSIAAATGIPRETVRRKLKRLVERGYITEKTRGHYVVVPGRLQGADYQAAFGRGIRETVRFMNECFERGLVRWAAGDPAKPGRTG